MLSYSCAAKRHRVKVHGRDGTLFEALQAVQTVLQLHQGLTAASRSLVVTHVKLHVCGSAKELQRKQFSEKC